MPDRELTEGQVRGRFRDLEPATADANNKSYARYVSLAPVTPLGHTAATVGSGGLSLSTAPEETRRVLIYPFGDIVYTDDGSTPSASHGMPVPGESHFIYDSEPFTLVLWAPVDTEVRLAFYG